MDRVGAVPAAGVPPPAPPPPPAQLGPTKILGTGGRPSANRQHIVGLPSTQPPVVPSQERSQPFAGVHPETLQHAAARLRPTQHRESLFSPERQQFLDGQDLLASGRHWADQPQHEALAKHSPGTTLHASSPYPNQPAALRFDAAHRDSLNASPSVGQQQQQHYQQYHHSQPHYFPHRPSPSSNSPSPHPPYSSSSSSYAFNSSSSPFSSNVPVKEVPIQMVGSQSGTPYSAATKFGSPSPDLIAEPRRHIHAYATQTPVSALIETTTEAAAAAAVPKWAPNGAGHWQRRVPKGAATGGDFARELRDAALTERQRAANLQQKSALKQPYASQLPSSLHNYAYQQTVSSTTTTTSKNANKNGGQAVDELIRDMETKMRNTTNATSKDICTKCQQQIGGDPPGVTALGSPYHVTCFCCDVCQKQLAGCSFYAVDGKNLCQVDYMNSLEKCDKCKMPITQKILRALGRAFHPECFACPICQKSLDGVPFTVDKENQAYCLECYHERFSPRCAACLKVIAPSGNETEVARVIAMDKSYHLDCYKCEDCGLKLNSKIEGQGCYPLEAHLFCKNCNLKRLKSLK